MNVFVRAGLAIAEDAQKCVPSHLRVNRRWHRIDEQKKTKETKGSAGCAWTTPEDGGLRCWARRARPSNSKSNLRSLGFLLLGEIVVGPLCSPWTSCEELVRCSTYLGTERSVQAIRLPLQQRAERRFRETRGSQRQPLLGGIGVSAVMYGRHARLYSCGRPSRRRWMVCRRRSQSTGLVKCSAKPAALAAATSLSAPKPLRAIPRN